MQTTTYRIEHRRYALYWNTQTTPSDGYWDAGDDWLYVTDDGDEAEQLSAEVDGVVYEINTFTPVGRSAAAALEGRV